MALARSASWLLAAGGAYFAFREIIRQQRRLDFRGQCVCLTGGSRGLGLVLARELLALGARLALVARDIEELADARAELHDRGSEVECFPCDITQREQVERMLVQVERRFGAIDVLINNAGVIQVGPVETMTLADYEEAMRTHYWGPLYLIHGVLPSMRRRGRGRIVNIASIGGKIAVPHLVPYAGSKFALVGLSEGLRAELLHEGIYVTTVCPGLMRTGSPRNATFKGQHRAEYAWFSISDALPLVSMSAERAARQILRACRDGDPEVILSFPANVAARLHGLFPGWTADVLGLVNAFLPGPGGIGSQRAQGKESESALAPSLLTALGDQAARQNNEIGSESRPLAAAAEFRTDH